MIDLSSIKFKKTTNTNGRIVKTQTFFSNNQTSVNVTLILFNDWTRIIIPHNFSANPTYSAKANICVAPARAFTRASWALATAAQASKSLFSCRKRMLKSKIVSLNFGNDKHSLCLCFHISI